MEKPGQCVACKEHEAHFRARHLSQKSWNKIRPWTPQTIFSFMLNSWLSCPKWVKDANILWFLKNYSFLQTSIRQLYTAKKIRVKTLRKKSGKNSLIWDSGIPTLHSQVNVKTDKLNFSWTLVYSTPNFLGMDCSVGAWSSCEEEDTPAKMLPYVSSKFPCNCIFFSLTQVQTYHQHGDRIPKPAALFHHPQCDLSPWSHRTTFLLSSPLHDFPNCRRHFHHCCFSVLFKIQASQR